MVSKQQLDDFQRNGYVVIDDVLDPVGVVQPIIDDYAELLDRLATKWHSEGSIASALKELGFVQRLTQIMSESSIDVSRYFDISLPDRAVSLEDPIHLSEKVFALVSNAKLLDVAESFVGPEILSNPVQHVRIKPPENRVSGKYEQNFLVRRTGWHQDQGVIRAEADETNMLTVWVPITPATVDNGCLCVIPGSHRGGLTTHCPGPDGLTIPDKLLGDEPIPIPMRVGSVLCMHRLTKHSSLANRSDVIRWSFDLRYQPIGQPTGRQEYPAIVVRSRKQPEIEVRDYKVWAQRWADARNALATSQRDKKHRWPEDAPICA